jgi:beta-mannanase
MREGGAARGLNTSPGCGEKVRLEIENAQPWMGLYLPDDLLSAPRKASGYRHRLGNEIKILSFYVAWSNENPSPDLAGIQGVVDNGFIPMITWEPWRPPPSWRAERPWDQPDFSLSEILAGKYDEYIRNWAAGLQEVRGPVILRPMHEMNGNWYPWCGQVNGNSPAAYVAAWRYLRSAFREAGDGAVSWVWSPYVHSVPDEPGNALECYFPGAGEVDWLGLDGYNWGASREWSRWQGFREVFDVGYESLIQLAPGKPFMIAETGCAEEGGDKGKWIEEAFELLENRYVRIKAMIWFNVSKECDWRIESSQGSLSSFRKSWSHLRNHFHERFKKG